MRARGFLPIFGAGLLVADQHGRRAVDDAGRIAGVMHVRDGLDLRIGLHRDRVEAVHLAHLHERGLQLRRATASSWSAACARPCARIVMPLTSFTGDDRVLEVARVPRRLGALLALDRIGVDVVAREAVFGRDQVGRDALRQEVGRDRDRRVHRPRAARRAHADAAHRLDAAADRHVVLAGHHLRGGEVDRVEPRGAEAVDLHARDRVAVAGGERRGARDVAARLADRIDAAEHHVVDQHGIEQVAVLDRAERLRGEAERRHLVQRAVGLALAARRAHGVVDECIGHLYSSSISCHPGRRAKRESRDPELTGVTYKLLAISSFMISLVPA